MEFNVAQFAPLQAPRRPAVPLKRVLEHLRQQDSQRRRARRRYKPDLERGPTSVARRGEQRVVQVKRAGRRSNNVNAKRRRQFEKVIIPSRLSRYPWKRNSDPVYIQKLNTHTVSTFAVKRIEQIQRGHPHSTFTQQLDAYLRKGRFTHTHIPSPLIQLIKWIVVYGKYNQEQNYDKAYIVQYTNMFNRIKDTTINRLYMTRRKEDIVGMLNKLPVNKSVLRHFIRMTYNAFKYSSETKFYNTPGDAKSIGGQYLPENVQVGGQGKAELLAEAAKAGFQFGSNVSADINRDDTENDRAIGAFQGVLDSANNFFRYNNAS